MDVDGETTRRSGTLCLSKQAGLKSISRGRILGADCDGSARAAATQCPATLLAPVCKGRRRLAGEVRRGEAMGHHRVRQRQELRSTGDAQGCSLVLKVRYGEAAILENCNGRFLRSDRANRGRGGGG